MTACALEMIKYGKIEMLKKQILSHEGIERSICPHRDVEKASSSSRRK